MQNYNTLNELTKDQLKEMLGDHPEVNTKSTKDQIIRLLLLAQTEGVKLSVPEKKIEEVKKDPEPVASEPKKKSREPSDPNTFTGYAWTYVPVDIRTDRCEELKIVDGKVVSTTLIAQDLTNIVRHKMNRSQYERKNEHDRSSNQP